MADSVRKTKKVKVSADKVLNKNEETKGKAKQNEAEGNVYKEERILDPSLKWYVLNIQSGHENSVAKAVKQRIDATNMQDRVTDILVPVQKKIVVKNGKQKIVEEKIFPGYVLIKMVLSNTTWELITSTEGVRGFVKADKYPRPLPENEVKAIIKFMELEQPTYQASFSVGEAVKITEGAFADFIGSVKEIDESKGKVKVLISFLGREAPVELDFSQISKL